MSGSKPYVIRMFNVIQIHVYFDQEFVLCTHMNKKIFRTVYQDRLVQKGTPKWEECIFSKENPKSFQSPMVGPIPQPIWAHFTWVTPLHFVGKTGQNNLGPP